MEEYRLVKCGDRGKQGHTAILVRIKIVANDLEARDALGGGDLHVFEDIRLVRVYPKDGEKAILIAARDGKDAVKPRAEGHPSLGVELHGGRGEDATAKHPAFCISTSMASTSNSGP